MPLNREKNNQRFSKVQLWFGVGDSRELVPSSYLGVLEAKQIWLQVIDDALIGSRKGDASDQEDDQHQVGKRGCEINNLEGNRLRSPLLGTEPPGGARDPMAVLLSALLRQQE